LSGEAAGAVAAGVAVGAAVALVVERLRLAFPPRSLIRTNYAGLKVPAVLGDGIVAGSLVALAALGAAGAAGWSAAETGRMGAAVALAVGIMGAAGRLDDLRGDEEARGFSGHLRAAVRGHLTGGALKLLAGGVAGLVAGALVASGIDVLTIGVLVALGANTFNLLDRAPGRAGKLWLLASVPLLVWGSSGWAVAAAGMGGALVAVLPADLGARGMLGDAGANPLGAVWGLGLASATGDTGRVIAIGALVLLNAASERWSFSRTIENVAWLRGLDQLGRK
jgi:UDP-GlcNAc:undecaprenyl-phosphate/decaprenyl-phosphate GlcNAc-1-phosphate transferase